MAASLSDILDTVDRLWPSSGAESWDASGLVTGDPEAPVDRIMLAVDAVAATVGEAVESGADLLLTHHPLLLRGVTSIAEDRYKGSLLAQLIRANCALLAAHTNADVVEGGTSSVIAERLGLSSASPIVPRQPSNAASTDAAIGLGRVGTLPESTTLGALARTLAHLLPQTATGVRVAGEYDREVRTIAICGGAGDSLLTEPAVRQADVYVTADLRHHPASEAVEQFRLGSGPALIDVSHWASEWLWLERAAEQLRAAHPSINVVVSELRTDPWDFAVV